MTDDIKVHARIGLFPRELYVPPRPQRSRRDVPPDQIKTWLTARCAKGGTRREIIDACCEELGAPRDNVRALWAELFPCEEGEVRGGRGKRLTDRRT
jgi:hypothetical protein